MKPRMEIIIAKRVTRICILCINHIMIMNLNSSQPSCNLLSPEKHSLFSVLIGEIIIITISSKVGGGKP